MIVKTLIHEVIHAEMFRKLMSLASSNGFIDTNKAMLLLENGDYPGMLDYYLRNGLDINSEWQHQQIAAHYRQTIGRILQEFDTGIFVADNIMPDQLYLDLAWEGLIYSNITAWNELYSDSERNRIQNVINSYIYQNKQDICIN